MLIICSAEIVRWVFESLCPFEIVDDRGFKRLMKTGRPEHYIPHPATVTRDVKLVFARAKERIARMLQVSAQEKQSSLYKCKLTRSTAES